jgi:hypothetical protein
VELVELSGRDYLDWATRLLQRCRLADPKGGLWEAADLQWWWRRVRLSDTLGQLFWLDDDGEPIAAFVLTDWDGSWDGEVVLAPGHREGLFAEVWQHGLERIAACEPETVTVRARDDYTALVDALKEAGFVEAGDQDTTTWLDAAARPAVSELPGGFRLLSRTETADRPHHMIRRNGERVAERLAGCSV